MGISFVLEQEMSTLGFTARDPNKCAYTRGKGQGDSTIWLLQLTAAATEKVYNSSSGSSGSGTAVAAAALAVHFHARPG